MKIKKVKLFKTPGKGSHHNYEDGGGVELTLEDDSQVKLSFNVGDEYTPVKVVSKEDLKSLSSNKESPVYFGFEWLPYDARPWRESSPWGREGHKMTQEEFEKNYTCHIEPTTEEEKKATAKRFSDHHIGIYKNYSGEMAPPNFIMELMKRRQEERHANYALNPKNKSLEDNGGVSINGEEFSKATSEQIAAIEKSLGVKD